MEPGNESICFLFIFRMVCFLVLFKKLTIHPIFSFFSWLLQHLVKAEEDAKAYKNEVYEKIVKRIMQMK